MAKDWKDLSDKLASALLLKTKPIGFKFLKKAEEINEIEGIQRSEFKRTVCQYLGGVRYLGQAWAATAEDQFCQSGAWKLGVSPYVPDIYAEQGLYGDKLLNIADSETAKLMVDQLPKNKDNFQAFAVMPLDGGRVADQITFEPDLVIIYGEPGQLGPLVLGACAALRIPAFSGRFLGDTGICSDGIPASWNSGEPKLFLPCIGDRAFGGTQTNEVAVVFPADKFNEDVVRNVQKSSIPMQMGLDAPLGASPEIVGLQKLMGSSEFQIDEKGTPLVPKGKPNEDESK
jgi:uncharacterized protein (DUF169 family)